MCVPTHPSLEPALDDQLLHVNWFVVPTRDPSDFVFVQTSLPVKIRIPPSVLLIAADSDAVVRFDHESAIFVVSSTKI